MQSEAKKKRRRGKAQNSNGSSPKRPAGAYLLFLRDFRRGFLQARPDVTVTAREVASAAGAAWRAIDVHLKSEYEAQSAAEKAKYACAKKEHAAGVPAGGSASSPPGSVPSCQAKPRAAAERNAALPPSALHQAAGNAAVGSAAEAMGMAAGEALLGAQEEEVWLSVGPGTESALPQRPAAEPPAPKAGPPAAAATALPDPSTLQPPWLQGGSPSRSAWGRSHQCEGSAAADTSAATAVVLRVATELQQPDLRAAWQAGRLSAEPGGPSGLSLFIQEVRAAYEVMFWCGPAPLPEAVLAAAHAWPLLASWQREEFANRQAQVQECNLALGMHTLIPDLEQQLVDMAAAAAFQPPAAAGTDGGQGYAQLQQLLDQLLASDVGPPPVLPSLAAVPPALQLAAGVAAQMAWAREMRCAPPEGQALMAATAQAVADATADAVAETSMPGGAAAPGAGVGSSRRARSQQHAAARPAAGAQLGGASAGLWPATCSGPSSAIDSVLGLLPLV